MGNRQESLGEFVREMKRVSGKAGVSKNGRDLFSYKTRINTGAGGSNIGAIEVLGHLPLRKGPIEVLYSIPALGLEAAPPTSRQREWLDTPLVSLLEGSKGSKVEVDTTLRPTGEVMDPHFWSVWNKGMIGEIYRNQIYPQAIKAIKNHLPLPEGEELMGVDLFGGDGQFAGLVVDCLASKGISTKMHVVDASIKSLEDAEDLSATKSGLLVVHKPIDLVEANDIFPSIDSPDLVTAIGGLCEKVIVRDDALTIAEKVYAGLKKGGIFVVTGISPVLLNAEDFSKIGFTVKQMTVPKNVLSRTAPFQMYVLQK